MEKKYKNIIAAKNKNERYILHNEKNMLASGESNEFIRLKEAKKSTTDLDGKMNFYFWKGCQKLKNEFPAEWKELKINDKCGKNSFRNLQRNDSNRLKNGIKINV